MQQLTDGEVLERVFLLKHREILEKNDYYYNWREFYKSSPSKIKKSCMEQGYYRDADSQEILSKLKVSDLKEILKENDLKVSGKKDELIERVTGVLSQEEIKEKYMDKPFYVLSELGKSIAEEYSYLGIYEDYFRSEDTTVFEYYKKMLETRNELESVKSILLEQASKYKRTGKYSYLKFRYLKLSDLNKKYEDYEESLNYLLKAIYIEFSGLGNNLDYYPESPSIYFNNIDKIEQAMEELDMDNKGLETLYYEAIVDLMLPQTLFTDEVVFDCILRMLDGEAEEVQNAIDNIIDQYEDIEDEEYDDFEDEYDNFDEEYEYNKKTNEFIMPNPNDIKDKLTKSKFWEQTWFAVIMLLFFSPVGVFLIWKYKKFHPAVRIIFSCFFALIFLADLLPG